MFSTVAEVGCGHGLQKNGKKKGRRVKASENNQSLGRPYFHDRARSCFFFSAPCTFLVLFFPHFLLIFCDISLFFRAAAFCYVFYITVATGGPSHFNRAIVRNTNHKDIETRPLSTLCSCRVKRQSENHKSLRLLPGRA